MTLEDVFHIKACQSSLMQVGFKVPNKSTENFKTKSSALFIYYHFYLLEESRPSRTKHLLRRLIPLMLSFARIGSGETRTQKFKTHMLRTQSSEVLPFKPGAGPHIAMHATLTTRYFLLSTFYPYGPFTCILPPKPLQSFSCIGCGQHRFLCGPA